MESVSLKRWTGAALPTVAVAAAAGVLGTRFAGRRKPSAFALGGFIGTAVGVGVALLWTSQYVTSVRDARWLATHPIDYA